ncbi:MAG: hypothetical protein ACFHX7_07395 [Pseudomonadota bacterium]
MFSVLDIIVDAGTAYVDSIRVWLAADAIAEKDTEGDYQNLTYGGAMAWSLPVPQTRFGWGLFSR